MRVLITFAAFLLSISNAHSQVPNWVTTLSNHQELSDIPSKTNKEEITCMASAIYFESRGENTIGQQAVGHVLLNRTHSGKYPKTVCGVLLQKGQFSFVKTGKSIYPSVKSQWDNAIRIAKQIMNGKISDVSGGNLRFCQYKLRQNGLRIGHHIFY